MNSPDDRRQSEQETVHLAVRGHFAPLAWWTQCGGLQRGTHSRRSYGALPLELRLLRRRFDRGWGAWFGIQKAVVLLSGLRGEMFLRVRLRLTDGNRLAINSPFHQVKDKKVRPHSLIQIATFKPFLHVLRIEASPVPDQWIRLHYVLRFRPVHTRLDDIQGRSHCPSFQ